jgi:hypothetical protein
VTIQRTISTNQVKPDPQAIADVLNREVIPLMREMRGQINRTLEAEADVTPGLIASGSYERHTLAFDGVAVGDKVGGACDEALADGVFLAFEAGDDVVYLTVVNVSGGALTPLPCTVFMAATKS